MEEQEEAKKRWWQMEGSAKIRGAEAESMEGMEAEVCGLAEEGCKDITSTADDDARSAYDHNMII